MIVCHCEVVSDRLIRTEVDQGAVSPEDIAQRCGAGARCGACRPTVTALLAALTPQPQAQSAA
jgi:bacterioferritin-associated ferredoxin